MTKKKKNRYTGLKVSIGIFLAFWFMALSGIFDESTKNLFINFNPDIHVCEEWEFNCNEVPYYNERYNQDDCNEKNTCSDFRDKTPQEILEQECKDNPNSNECSCEEEEFEEKVEVIVTYFDVNTGKINQSYTCNPNGICNIPYYLTIGGTTYLDSIMLGGSTRPFNLSIGCTQATPIPKPIEINLEEERCVEHINGTINTKYGEVYCSKLHLSGAVQVPINQNAYDKYCCTKKEELNECEKGNPDFVEEVETDCGTFRKDQWELNTSQCLNPITTCREKTKLEKLKDKSCDELEYKIHVCGGFRDLICTINEYQK